MATQLASAHAQFAADPILRQHLPAGLRDSILSENGATFLEAVSYGALVPQCTERVFVIFEHLMPEICARWTKLAQTASVSHNVTIVACFAKILPFARYLSSAICQLFSSDQFNTSTKGILDDGELAVLLLASFRLLSTDPELFSDVIKPTFLSGLLSHKSVVIRFLAIQCLCIVMRFADAFEEKLIQNYIGDVDVSGVWEDKQINYRILKLMEEQRWAELTDRLKTFQQPLSSDTVAEDGRDHYAAADLSPSSASLAGMLVLRKGPLEHSLSSFVETQTASHNLRALGKALLQQKPVLLLGSGGSGKSALVRESARLLNTSSSMVTLHLNEQTDAKSLLGLYTSSSTGDAFVWRPGVLTKAIQEGRWVLIEDIDRAPSEVLGVLRPIIENRELFLPSRKESIRPKEGFRMLATIKTSIKTGKVNIGKHPWLTNERLWNICKVNDLAHNEIEDMLSDRYPSLGPLLPSIIQAHDMINQAYQHDTLFRAVQGRLPSLRDLFKWCRRVSRRLGSRDAVLAASEVPARIQAEIFKDGMDCYAAYHSDALVHRAITKHIGRALNISPQQVDHLTEQGDLSVERGKDCVRIGRTTIHRNVSRRQDNSSRSHFALTSQSARLLDSVAAAVDNSEPTLLVGETGVGKTSQVQYVADLIAQKLTVVNLSQQSEVADLLGGLKPITTRSLLIPLVDQFNSLFDDTFSNKRNEKFQNAISKAVVKENWARLVILWEEAVQMAKNSLDKPFKPSEIEREAQSAKRRKLISKYGPLRERWSEFASKLAQVRVQVERGNTNHLFAFVEGRLVQAVRSGEWLLLDEINLASADTLDNIVSLLSNTDDEPPSLLLTEAGQIEQVKAHPNFRIFAAMNPATDTGKKDLAPGIRSRFTELYVPAGDDNVNDLVKIIETYIGPALISDKRAAADLANAYVLLNKLKSEHKLTDGAGEVPHFSIRSLVRCLLYMTKYAPSHGLRRSMYEGFAMSFFTVLSIESEQIALPLINSHLLSSIRNIKGFLSQQLSVQFNEADYVPFKHHLVQRGNESPDSQPHYIRTPSVERNLLNLARAASMRRFPILLQGPTSVGKTSMIEFLAKFSGNRFVRINNHEHTDLQEYLGNYATGDDGKLEFREGILVEALRKGHWIVLDELNLAPTDVLEALNRLLDDNRELLIPESQEVVRPHPNFMLFATQNPAGLYGGRKRLSRAFRNRFLELHFNDIPENELEIILRERAQIAPSFCGHIVQVYKKLSLQRQSTRLFESRNSFATLRDLFRWAARPVHDRQQLAQHGFMLLAERVRDEAERSLVKRTIEETLKVRIDEQTLYNASCVADIPSSKANIVWTPAMRRLFVLVSEALKNNEPVLLVGETGCGKTQICQVIAQAFGRQLSVYNAHSSTETGDLVGSQRPIRQRSELAAAVLDSFSQLYTSDSQREAIENQDLNRLIESFAAMDTSNLAPEAVEQTRKTITAYQSLFAWNDGSLVRAMKSGDYFLLDEISLADDSVLERLNSVLEPSRTIVLAEKGPVDNQVVANPTFQFLATMNPGGDYGKRELSAALRNRLTEIWVPPLSQADDILPILRGRLGNSNSRFANAMLDYATWFKEELQGSAASTISLRSLLTWAEFIEKGGVISADLAFVHGACMVYVDALGANPAGLVTTTASDVSTARQTCLKKLQSLSQLDVLQIYGETPELQLLIDKLILGSFVLPRIVQHTSAPQLVLEAPTTLRNSMRIVRALQMNRPILLEGNPGVGKTAIVTELASLVGKKLTRINLSDQTDLMDLFGADAPSENERLGRFSWRDGPLLQAMQTGGWVLLDEMNLASQSVLEGLNSCLDHRHEVYIAELDKSFACHPEFTLFAAQNPHHQGGGRKGLPASFVNRFTVVYADPFEQADLLLICKKTRPEIPEQQSFAVVDTICHCQNLVSQSPAFSNGGPWELNLRDINRWLDLRQQYGNVPPAKHFETVISPRFRSETVVGPLNDILKRDFDCDPMPDLYHNLSPEVFQLGTSFLARNAQSRHVLTQQPIAVNCLSYAKSVILALNQKWPVLLVGPSGSGKTKLIRALAALSGAKLTEFSMNSDVDTMDLIGGFEQYDSRRDLLELQTVCCEILNKLICERILSGDDPDDLSALNYAYERCVSKSIDIQSFSYLANSLAERYQSLEPVNLRLSKIIADSSTSRFVWNDGILVDAIRHGWWLVLDNANLCNPSVLDRLNSLLEPNGALAISEQHNDGGEERLIRPHPQFRIFLTMDPRYGELSRAMRNRSLEIFMGNTTQSQDLSACPTYPASASVYRLRYLFQQDIQHMTGKAVAITSDPCLGLLSPKEIASVDKELASLAGRDVSMNQVQVGLDSFLQLPRAMQSFWPQMLANIGAEIDNHLANYLRLISSGDLPQTFAFNHALASLLSSTSSPSCDLKLYTRQYFGELERIRLWRIMDNSIKAAADLNKTQMTIFQKSITGGKNLPEVRAGEIVPQVHGFLTTLAMKYLATERPLSSENSVKNLSLLLMLCKDMFDLFNARTFNPAVFQAYIQIAEDMLREMTTDRSTFREGLRAALSHFDARFVLQSGRSLQRMWPTWKPETPSTQEQLELQIRVEYLLVRFDELAKSRDHQRHDLATIRLRLDDALAQIQLADGFSSPLSSLTEAVEALSTGLNTRRLYNGQFTWVFDQILPRLIIQGKEPAKLDLHRFSLLAKRSLPVFAQQNQHEVPQLLRRLAYYGSSVSDDTSLAITRLISDLNTLNNQPLGAFVSAREELDEVMSCLSVYNFDLRADVIPSVLSHALGLVSSILSCHDDLLIESVRTCYAPISGLDFVKLDKLGQSAIKEIHASEVGYFRDVYVMYLLPVFALLSQNNRPSDYLVGMTLIYICVAALKLIVPDKVYDPAVLPGLLRQRHQKRQGELQQQIASYQDFQIRFTGQRRDMTTLILEEDLERLGQVPTPPTVVRPHPSDLHLVQAEFSNLIRSLIGTSDLSTIFSVAGSYQTRRSEIGMASETMQRACFRIADRLSGLNRAYDDITKPVSWLVETLCLGSKLLRRSTIAVPEAPTISMPKYIPLLGYVLDEAIGHVPQALFGKKQVDIFWLDHLQFCNHLENGLNRSLDRTIDNYLALTDKFYIEWKTRLTKDQAIAEANSRYYDYRGEDGDTQETELADVMSMFPTYETDNENSEDKDSMGFDAREIAIRLAQIHRKFSRIDDSQETLSSYMLRSLQVIRETEGEVDNLFTNSLMPGVFLQMEKASLDLEGPTPTQGMNIYNESNLMESQKIVRLVHKVVARFTEIAERWPEHATPAEVLAYADEMLAFKINEPIAKLLTKTEKLLVIVAQWQSIASREWSVASLVTDTTDLIIHWRRLELQSWSKLLDIERRKMIEDANAWYFVAYEAVLYNTSLVIEQGSDVKVYCQELSKTLEGFLKTTVLGQFRSRLQLLETFNHTLCDLSSRDHRVRPIFECVSGIIFHYQRYDAHIQSTLSNGHNRLEKDITEQIKLASWKDTNIQSLRESARRSHFKLFKIVKKYRALLAQPISSFKASEIQSVPISAPQSLQLSQVDASHLQEARLKCMTEVRDWALRPTRLTDPVGATMGIKRLYEVNLKEFNVPEEISAFHLDVAASAKDLRKQTPQILTEDNKSLVRHLRERKRRLFVDTLRGVAHMGVRRNLAVGELDKQNSISTILATSPDLDVRLDNSVATQLANTAFHGVLDNMNDARTVAIDHSADLTDGETRRAIGSLEGLLSIQIAQRTDLHNAAENLLSFKEAIQLAKSMQTFALGSMKKTDRDHLARRHWLEKSVCWLPSILETSCQILRFQSAHGRFDVTELTSNLEEFKIYCTSAKIEIQSLPRLPQGLITESIEGMLIRLESEIQDFGALLREWQRREPKVTYLLEQIVPWTSLSGVLQGDTNGISVTTCGQLDSLLGKLLESVFVAIQNVASIQRGSIGSPEDQGWLVKSDKTFKDSIKSSHLEDITRQLQNLLSLLQHISPNELNLSTSLMALAAPILDQFYLVARHLYEKQLRTHLETARLSAFLSETFILLAKEGFCTPHGPSDGQDEQSGKLESGTGLGEGEGAEDISKDIGQDEDLSELAQADTEKEDGDQEMNREQDAVDMGAEDLEGDMGSGDEQESGDEKGDERSDSDGEDDMDEETGSVDDLDPSAVDERLWNDMQAEAEKESKEMKGSKQKGQESDEQTAKESESKNEDDDEMQDEDDISSTEEDQEEPEGQGRPEAESLDPHLQEEQALDLPEEIQLNGEEETKNDEISDDGMEELSDIENLDQPEPSKVDEDSDIDEDQANNVHSEDEFGDASEEDHEAEGKAQDDEVVEEQPDANVQDEEEDGFNPLDNKMQSDYEANEGGDAGVADQREDIIDQDMERNVPGQNDQQDVVNEQQSSAGKASDQQESGETGRGATEQGVGRENEQRQKQDDALKRLADVVEQFHQRREILTSSDDRKQGELDEDVDMGDADFEHLGDEGQNADAQALGAANIDQVQKIDETKAIESQDATADQNLPMPEDIETQDTQPSDTIVDRLSRLQAQAAQPKEMASDALLPNDDYRKGHQKFSSDAEILEEEPHDDIMDIDMAENQLRESPPTSSADAVVLWSHCSKQTHSLSLLLTEQLRLILAPTMATKLRGDFRTGKRLNIKRIIPYIASGYKRDKIWMRRSVPSKRNYQIMIAVDDSKSMSESGADILAFETLAMLCKSLSMLEVGELCVVTFGDQDHICVAHPFGQPFAGSESGTEVFRSFSFQQRGTDVRKLLKQSIAVFEDARLRSNTSNDDLWQLQLIISDGHCSDHEDIRRLVRAAHEKKIMIVFVIVDAGQDSIVDLKEAVFERVDPADDRSEMKVSTKRYLESFPFGYYVVVREVADLPGVLARVLKGWFEGVVNVG